MTHFYFHTWRDDQRSADATGRGPPHQTQAPCPAARVLGEMARDLLHASAKDVALGIDIVDGDGALLARLRLAYTLKPEP